MAELGWREAVVKVLEATSGPMHYTDIAEAIAAMGLRTEFGATPASAVTTAISLSMQKEGTSSPFVRVSRGYYALRSSGARPAEPTSTPETTDADEAGLIKAFGMYWARPGVLWIASPKLLGQQQPGSTPVDFSTQRGVYLLHDGRAVVYVGRTTDQTLGVRLRQHTVDRLKGRWDRFSWFGVYAVGGTGSIETVLGGSYGLDALITTMEALLIEGLEPPQNRKRGDDFRAVEFIQVEDPEIKKSQIVRLMDELKEKL